MNSLNGTPPPTENGHYHLHVHTISKLKNQSALAAAAYRRGERLMAEASVTHAAAYQRAQQLGNDGQVFDYRRKIGVAWTGIMAPAFTPKDLLDAQTLWNTVERIEFRKNARMAREMVIALPYQVDLATQVEMLRRFVTANLVTRGMVADVAVHRPPVEHGGDPRNWHAHVLLTDRPMTPTGFAATKDRNWNARENITLWRKAWSDTHNSMMEELGLPHRIDHRSLDAQRAEVLQRGDTIAALDLDRTPQIHVGKAAYGQHPGRTIYRDRRERNGAILTANKDLAAANADAMDAAIARMDTAAYLEARINAIKHDTWQTPELSDDDLRATYGRPEPATMLSRLRVAAIRSKADIAAMNLARDQGFPWRADGEHRPGTPSIFSLLQPMIGTTGPGHPFTVTAKDIAFALYGWGWITRRDLQTSLENVAQEEQRLFADREARKTKPTTWPPIPKPPRFPTPKAETLVHYRKTQPFVDAIYLKRLAQLQAYKDRHIARQANRRNRQTQQLARLLKRQADNIDASG